MCLGKGHEGFHFWLVSHPPEKHPPPLPGPTLQLVTRRNEEFFLPSDAAPAGSAVEAQLEELTKRQLDAAKVAEEAERWERVRLWLWLTLCRIMC